MDARDREIKFYDAMGVEFARVQEEGKRVRPAVPKGSSSTLQDAIAAQFTADSNAAAGEPDA